MKLRYLLIPCCAFTLMAASPRENTNFRKFEPGSIKVSGIFSVKEAANFLIEYERLQREVPMATVEIVDTDIVQKCLDIAAQTHAYAQRTGIEMRKDLSKNPGHMALFSFMSGKTASQVSGPYYNCLKP